MRLIHQVCCGWLRIKRAITRYRVRGWECAAGRRINVDGTTVEKTRYIIVGTCPGEREKDIVFRVFASAFIHTCIYKYIIRKRVPLLLLLYTSRAHIRCVQIGGRGRAVCHMPVGRVLSIIIIYVMYIIVKVVYSCAAAAAAAAVAAAAAAEEQRETRRRVQSKIKTNPSRRPAGVGVGGGGRGGPIRARVIYLFPRKLFRCLWDDKSPKTIVRLLDRRRRIVLYRLYVYNIIGCIPTLQVCVCVCTVSITT
jgi:hypothetical protein